MSWDAARAASALLLAEAGHDGTSCGFEAMTITMGPAGSRVFCRCGAVLWTRDLADLREVRRGVPAPPPCRGQRPKAAPDPIIERMERAEPAATRRAWERIEELACCICHVESNYLCSGVCSDCRRG